MSVSSCFRCCPSSDDVMLVLWPIVLKNAVTRFCFNLLLLSDWNHNRMNKHKHCIDNNTQHSLPWIVCKYRHIPSVWRAGCVDLHTFNKKITHPTVMPLVKTITVGQDSAMGISSNLPAVSLKSTSLTKLTSTPVQITRKITPTTYCHSTLVTSTCWCSLILSILWNTINVHVPETMFYPSYTLTFDFLDMVTYCGLAVGCGDNHVGQ